VFRVRFEPILNKRNLFEIRIFLLFSSHSGRYFAGKKKKKMGISVKKFPLFKQLEWVVRSKFLIPGDFFAESRQQRTYNPVSGRILNG
jgi:hypothetical protein